MDVCCGSVVITPRVKVGLIAKRRGGADKRAVHHVVRCPTQRPAADRGVFSTRQVMYFEFKATPPLSAAILDRLSITWMLNDDRSCPASFEPILLLSPNATRRV